MFKGLVVFGMGVYTGMYIAQNYELGPVNEPHKILESFKEFADKFKKS